MADESKHRYLFVAIDRATRWAHIQILANKSVVSARRFLQGFTMFWSSPNGHSLLRCSGHFHLSGR